ncbi:MAG TPA: UDP-N-acetylglucosamine 2-epimerase [Ignavibacteriales bacterium]|nr:UDP-N-acetylglucosamine 2-epimerase [Ignavibacteriales bacterium]
MKTICVFTSSRADYGILKPLLKLLKKNNNFNLQLLVSGMHLVPQYGNTIEEIEQDNFDISAKVDILLASNTRSSVAKSIGIGLINYSDILEKLKPDISIVLGDRFETFSFSIACHVLNIPLVHIHGGEITEGAIDDGFRHSITKLSYLHFTSTEEYRQNVIQLGEEPFRVFNVGALAIDNIKNLVKLSREEFEKRLGIKLKKYNFLITYHPVTLDKDLSKIQFSSILKALDKFNDTLLIFTAANADPEGMKINDMIKDYTKNNTNKAIFIPSLGQFLYFNALNFVDVIIGNSSSGIIEAPSFKIPTINIGDRQKGRTKAISVIDSSYDTEEIYTKIKYALSDDFQKICKSCVNPYGDGNSAKKIINILENYSFDNIKKKFYKIRGNNLE